jgi:hypothetical protein
MHFIPIGEVTESTVSILAWRKIAEDRIRASIERGDFDDLPGKGKPQNLQDDSNLPEDLRLAYKVLKNAGYTPPELDVRKELMQVEDLLVCAPDEASRYQALKRLNYLAAKLSAIRPQSAILEEHRYSSRVLDRLTTKKK